MSDRQPGSREEIAKLLARFGSAVLTRARPLDVSQLLPAGYVLNAEGRDAVIAVAEETLDDFLSEDGVYWRGAELDYWILLPNCARSGWALKWNAITGGLFHLLRERLKSVVPEAPRPSHSPLLSASDFEQAVARCRKRGTAPSVLTIDLGEVLFGEQRPSDVRLSRRIWSVIETILDGYFYAGGHYVRMEHDRIGLLMPNLGPALAALKRDVIIQEIRHLLTREPAEVQPAAALRAGGAQPLSTPAPAVASAEEKTVWTQTFQAMLAALPLDAAAVVGDGGEAILRYDPVYRVRQGLIAGNLLRVEMRGPQGDGEAEANETRRDFVALADAVHRLRPVEGGVERRVGILIVPVSFDLLDHLSSRTLYLTLCSQIEAKRRSMLVFELFSVPRDLRSMRLDERIRQLRPFCRNVVIRADLSRSDFTQFDCLPSRLVGVDLSLYQAADPVLMDAMATFGRRAQAAGYLTYAHGVDSQAAAGPAIESGFEFLSGEAIAARVAQPQEVAPWTVPQRG